MKYVDEYREGDAARRIAAEIRHEADPKRIYRFMEFCGGHTHVLARWGLTDILPPNVRMIHGPGCPVCVLPVARIDMAMQLALERNVILCTLPTPCASRRARACRSSRPRLRARTSA